MSFWQLEQRTAVLLEITKTITLLQLLPTFGCFQMMWCTKTQQSLRLTKEERGRPRACYLTWKDKSRNKWGWKRNRLKMQSSNIIMIDSVSLPTLNNDSSCHLWDWETCSSRKDQMLFGTRLPQKFRIGSEAEWGEVNSCKILGIGFGHVKSSKKGSGNTEEKLWFQERNSSERRLLPGLCSGSWGVTKQEELF
jgi:hypothetical protein